MPTTNHTLTPTPPYDFHATARHATYHSERYAADTLEEGAYSRALELDGKTALLTVRSVGDVESPELQVAVSSEDALTDADRLALTRVASRLVGAHGDLSPFYAAVENDAPIAEIVRRFRGLGNPQSASPFEALVLAILGQQISNHVAGVLRNLLVDTLGSPVSIDGETRRLFPSALTLADVGPDALRDIKFSTRKAEYICDIAAAVASGALDLDSLADLPADDIIRRLTALRGVGPWTAHWLLVRAYAHPDGFPDGDLAVQRALGVLYNDGARLTAGQAARLSERWKPHRSLLTTYLFAAIRAGMIGSG